MPDDIVRYYALVCIVVYGRGRACEPRPYMILCGIMRWYALLYMDGDGLVNRAPTS